MPLDPSEDAAYIRFLALCLILEMFSVEAWVKGKRPGRFDAFSKIPWIQHTRRWRIHVVFGTAKSRYRQGRRCVTSDDDAYFALTATG